MTIFQTILFANYLYDKIYLEVFIQNKHNGTNFFKRNQRNSHILQTLMLPVTFTKNCSQIIILIFVSFYIQIKSIMYLMIEKYLKVVIENEHDKITFYKRNQKKSHNIH